jgi:hypothetical protein
MVSICSGVKFMKHCSNNLFFIALTFVLGLPISSLNATAAISNEASNSVFNVHGNSTFSNHLDTGAYSFNNFFYSTANGDLPLAAESNVHNWPGLLIQGGNSFQGHHPQSNFGTPHFAKHEGIHFAAANPVSPVPEPGNFALLAIGFALLAIWASRRKTA